MYPDFLLATDCEGVGSVATGAASNVLNLLSRHKRNPSSTRAIHPSGIPTPAPITIPRSDELDFTAEFDEDFDVFPSEPPVTAVEAEVELEVIVSPDISVVMIALTSFSTVAVTVTLAAVAVVVVILSVAELMSACSAS
jgi:hypothetical protein